MANSDQVSKSIDAWAVARIKKVQSTLVTDIQTGTPVDTGRARDGTKSVIEVEKLGDIGLIRNEVPYIGYLEFGTEKGFEHAMFRNAIAKVGK